ncbi:hypothetical protein ACIBUY_37870 [Streptomyces sp. NPDC050085]|uniref:hypothetical protein n=1 Tax=Streptomyces sp. NPDC050085 TaxID=3365600 RepID=UPI003798B405
MSNSRVIRTTLVSAALGIGAVTALASTAGAATPNDVAPQPAADSAAASNGGGSQDIHLSDGSVAHVTDLGGGKWQAKITRNGHSVASLDSQHASSRVHGYTYELNQANGFVGVQEPSGWHSESDVARPDVHQHQHGGPVHHGQHGERGQHGQRGQSPVRQEHQRTSTGHSAHRAAAATRDVKLPGGAVAHITQLGSGKWQAWITLDGVRIAHLDNAHPTARAHGYTYTLNLHTGAVTAHK